MPQSQADIRLIGVKDSDKIAECVASSFVDVACVERMAGPVIDLILVSDASINLRKLEDREWITRVIIESLAERDESGVEIHFPQIEADKTDDDSPVVWELRSSVGVLAKITVTSHDFPRTTPAFEPLRHLFVVHPNRESSLAARTELEKQGVVLLPAGGFPMQEFTLQVDGSEGAFQFIG